MAVPSPPSVSSSSKPNTMSTPLRSYNTDVKYGEVCPGRPPCRRLPHSWRTVKGTRKPHPTKKGSMTEHLCCQFCNEVITTEMFFV